jgi:hypothetical protein
MNIDGNRQRQNVKRCEDKWETGNGAVQIHTEESVSRHKKEKLK